MKIRIGDSKRHFIDESGNPLMWIADTAWNAALRGCPEDWEIYLSERKRQGFTVIQFVTMPWHGCTQPVGGQPYTIENGNIEFHEAAWAYLDKWIERVRAHGLIPAPVMLWALLPYSPGRSLSIEHAIQICRKQLERWGGEDVVWLLSGDAELRSPELVKRWKKIGREVFADNPEAIVTLHTCGVSWAVDLFANEPWYGIGGIQSGHGATEGDLRFLLNGPFSYRWQDLQMPFINLEPCYELAKPFNTTRFFTRLEIRRALIWSLLSAPTAGVTYGNNSIWTFAQHETEEAEGHGPHWMATHWKNGLSTEGIEDFMRIRSLLESLPWYTLAPANHLLFEQPGFTDPEKSITLAATPQMDCLVAYLPAGGRISFSGLEVKNRYTCKWWNPADGTCTDASPEVASFSAIEENCHSISAPDERDWLLIATC